MVSPLEIAGLIAAKQKPCSFRVGHHEDPECERFNPEADDLCAFHRLDDPYLRRYNVRSLDSIIGDSSARTPFPSRRMPFGIAPDVDAMTKSEACGADVCVFQWCKVSKGTLRPKGTIEPRLCGKPQEYEGEWQ